MKGLRGMFERAEITAQDNPKQKLHIKPGFLLHKLENFWARFDRLKREYDVLVSRF